MDSTFTHISTSEKFWQKVIDEYYTKYSGIKAWHDKLISIAMENGRLDIPSGRFFPIHPDYRKSDPWPSTIIKNYPVQGFGADLVMLARLELRRRLSDNGLLHRALFVSTVHDSIVLDVDNDPELCYTISKMLKESVEAVPALCKKCFDYDFSLPLTAEVQMGPNKLNMKEVKF